MKRVGMLVVAVVIASCAEAQAPHNSVKLYWTAVGDDSLSGRAAAYDLRYSTAPITEANFASATRVTTTAPSIAGAPDSALVTGLTPSTGYWFALKAGDEAGNWSALGTGSQVSYTTSAAPDAVKPASIFDLRRTR